MFLVPLLLIILIVWIIFHIANSSNNYSSPNYRNNSGYSLDKSLEILRERYAKGDISEEEYLRIKRNLER